MLIFKELRGHGNRYREIKGPMWHRAVNYRIEHRPHDVSGLSGLPGLFVVCLHGDTPTRPTPTLENTRDATRRIQDSDPNYWERGGGGGKGKVVIRNFDTPSLFLSSCFFKKLIIRETRKNLKFFKNCCTRLYWSINFDGMILDNRSYRECKIKFIPFEQMNRWSTFSMLNSY